MCDLVAAFLAKGGSIQKVEEGERAMSSNDLYQQVRGETVQDSYSNKRPQLSTFGRLDRQTGGSMSDAQLLAMAEMENCA